MFGIGKKKHNADAPDTAADTQESKRGAKAKKKKDGMYTIFQESVVETSVEEFKANEPFIVEKDGENVFVAMLLAADDIGGLGKKSKKDEAKGQFIEEVRSGLIKTYMPEEFIENEKMVIIPDPSTLAAMDEFMMLVDAPYTVCYVHEDGSVDTTESAVTYERMSAVADGSADILDVLADAGESWVDEDVAPSMDDDIAETEATASMDIDSEDEIEDDMPSEDMPEDEVADLDLDDEAGFDDVVSDDVYEDVPADEIPADEFVPEDDMGMPLDSPVMEDDDTEVTEEQMAEAITRRFYSDDLGLEISTEAFDAQFLHTNPYIPFDENRGDGWLNQYLNQMSKDANIEMRRLHQQNLFEMREMFYQLISKHSETIQHELDADDPETLYGQMLDAIKEQRSQARDTVDNRVSARRKEIDEDWNKKLTQVGEDAKRAAEQQYRERFGRQHDEAIYRIEPDIRGQIDADYDTSVREMHAKRRDDASKRMDYGITETLAEVSKLYMERLAQETEEYKNWRQRMNDFLDNHRKDEVAHDQALAEELSQKNKADKVLEEYTAKLKEQTEDFEAKKQSMKAEIEAMDRKTAVIVHDKQIECDNRIAEMQKNIDDQKAQMAALLDKYAVLDESKEKQYSARLAEAHDEKEAWADKCEHIISMHKKSNIVAVALAAVACIAMLAIGTLIGSNLNLDFGSKHASEKVMQEFNSRMDKIENKKSEPDNKASDSAKPEAETTNKSSKDSKSETKPESKPAPADGSKTESNNDAH